ncbi:receptor-like protein EIX2 [Aegilops tauschii subsp. strangulata]|uniref:Leucine-rich repeat-containing N-terminal plant-type domain-containing protein n=1 Tax=Aegilops tauschii subsp. strangulata TaxID=200361 RepID=A0A453QMI0_AEGTS|nr:receptor-like protein EIX1 [Aegilops tauschii subsp. strangulata]
MASFAAPVSSMDAAAALCLVLILATTTTSPVYGQQTNNGGCITKERDALLSFRAGIRSDPQNLFSSWNGRDCCQWSGVRCSNRTGHVVKLDVRNGLFLDDIYRSWYSENPHGMRGNISSSLVALHHLEYLDLSGNYLSGVDVPIPGFLGSLQSLRYLNLSSMDFHGKVPPQLGNLSRLLYLDLNNNWNHNSYGMMLHIEDISWLLRLALLRFLDLTSVNLSAIGNWVQVVNTLYNLRVLRLRRCGLVFPQTPTVHSNLTSLQIPDLSDTGFHTINPTYWFWDVGTIMHLDLTNNEIAEAFPDAMGNMTSLEVLHLGGNHLTSIKPEVLGNLCYLRVLTLWSNLINQDISQFLQGLPHCAWSKMELLDMSCTNVTGEIPRWINQWTDLSTLQLSSNRLEGSVPSEIGMLGKLKQLYLDGNYFNGSISEEHLDTLVNLEELDLSYNSLHLMISSNWIPPFKLRRAYFPRCKMGPHFPLWLNWQKGVVYLDISDAGIVDNLPDWFWSVVSNVQYLNISFNQISGRLPRTLEFMSSAVIFDLNSNNLTGTLPLLPRQLAELDISRNSLSGPLPRNFGAPFIEELLLSENSINGSIPTYICQLQSLLVLDLAKNLLAGHLPVCSEETKKLNRSIRALVLYENNLSGEFPSFLKSCSELVLLDLAHNNFVGELPAWLANKLPNLSYLRLRHNKFSGSIPGQLTQLEHLQYVDLADNRISGSIPHSLANLKAMIQEDQTIWNPLVWSYERPANPDTNDSPKYDDSLAVVIKGQDLDYTSTIIYIVGLDLSCNSLVGEIPDELTSLVRMNNLNISHNQLSGRIPEKVGSLRSLESLDLSFNELSGDIPSGLSDIMMLSKLNLSYNNLSGRIPSGNQLQSLIDPASSYIGNNYLCGTPLSRNCWEPDVTRGDIEEHQDEAKYFYLGLAAGFVFGLWLVFIIFLFRSCGGFAMCGAMPSCWARLPEAQGLALQLRRG